MAVNHVKPEYFLKYPQDLGVHPHVTYEAAANMLLRAVQIASSMPFLFSYIDKPRDGSLFVVFLLPNYPEFPNDSIVFQDNEKRVLVDAGLGRKLEIAEIKNGFVPDEDTAAYRVRRRYRLVQGGNPQLNLIHYSRGQPVPILPAFMNRQVRKYPLPPLNEAPMYVLGERQGQRAPLGSRLPVPGQQAVGALPPAGMSPMGMHPGQQAAMLAAQSRNMDAHRSQQQQTASGQGSHYEEDSGDEYDHITTRTLALARFKRNHDYMNEVFLHAAYGDRLKREIKSPYSCFNEEELKQKIAKLQKDVDELESNAAARRAVKLADGGLGSEDITMETMSAAPVDMSV